MIFVFPLCSVRAMEKRRDRLLCPYCSLKYWGNGDTFVILFFMAIFSPIWKEQNWRAWENPTIPIFFSLPFHPNQIMKKS